MLLSGRIGTGRFDTGRDEKGRIGASPSLDTWRFRPRTVLPWGPTDLDFIVGQCLVSDDNSAS